MVLKWLFPVSTEESTGTFTDKEKAFLARFAAIERKIVDIELRMQHASATLSKGAPGMSNLRPGYQSRSSKIAMAQAILNEKKIPDAPTV